jgi:7-carboxy-7-deazaguanine synthase
MTSLSPKIEPALRPDASTIVVHEIYVSLQGESSHQGLVCSFVRLTGCHLRCAYCDSAFAFQGGTRRSIQEVVQEVRDLRTPMVEITGGEPLLQPGVYPLMQALLDDGLKVLLETSGAIDVRLVPPEVHKIVDLKTPSSGESARNELRCFDSMTARDELKFVIGSRDDYEWSVDMIRKHELARAPFGLLFSTVFGAVPLPNIAEWIVQDRLPVRFQLQQHKYIWPPDARGV